MLVDRFEIDERAVLGTGGFGQVFAALDTQTGEKVAAKVIDTKRMRREKVLKEIQLMERVATHAGVIGLRGAQEVADMNQIFIFMELATAGELFGRVVENGKLEEHEAVRYFSEVASAVGYLHEQGVVHRDLKLENVLLTADGTSKLCDFGLAHAYDVSASGEVVRAQLKEVCGSKSYAAPEVLAGLGYSGEAADVWSLGICLFAMLAGFFPLDEAAGSDWRYAKAQRVVDAGGSITQCIFGLYSRPCPLSAEAIELIDAMLCIDPAQRGSAGSATRTEWATGGKLDHERTKQVFGRGAVVNAPSFGSAMPSYDSSVPSYGSCCPSYGGASVGSSMGVVSFGAQASMAMSFDFGTCGGDGPVYRACGAGGGAPAAPTLTKQKAFVRE